MRIILLILFLFASMTVTTSFGNELIIINNFHPNNIIYHYVASTNLGQREVLQYEHENKVSDPGPTKPFRVDITKALFENVLSIVRMPPDYHITCKIVKPGYTCRFVDDYTRVILEN